MKYADCLLYQEAVGFVHAVGLDMTEDALNFDLIPVIGDWITVEDQGENAFDAVGGDQAN